MINHDSAFESWWRSGLDIDSDQESNDSRFRVSRFKIARPRLWYPPYLVGNECGISLKLRFAPLLFSFDSFSPAIALLPPVFSGLSAGLSYRESHGLIAQSNAWWHMRRALSACLCACLRARFMRVLSRRSASTMSPSSPARRRSRRIWRASRSARWRPCRARRAPPSSPSTRCSSLATSNEATSSPTACCT